MSFIRMALPLIAALVIGAICGAAGQLLIAAGARGRTELLSFLNIWIIAGLGAYGFGMVFWIYALSRAQLIQVYPFTVLTFVLIYLTAAVLFGERPSVLGLCGVTLVLAGLLLLSVK